MAQVSIEVNGRSYLVGCEDGQEGNLRELAKLYDGHVRRLSGEVGQLGEARMLLMGALVMADDLADTRLRLAQAQVEASRLSAQLKALEARAAAALDGAARRIEALAELGQTGTLL